MWIEQLCIQGLRNLENLQIHCGRHINLLYGPNGSGKTSLLEAMHYLSYARSFRTHRHQHLIHYTQDAFSIFAQLHDPCINHQTNVGIERHRKKQAVRIRIAMQEATVSDLAKRLPLHIIHSDSYLLITAGASLRRQLMDWVLFHVEPNFLHAWRSAERLLRQRNHLLKQPHLDPKQLASWDAALITQSTYLSTSRKRCVDNLKDAFHPIWTHWLGDYLPAMDWQFYQGWPAHQSLKETLHESFAQDRKWGHTHYGPHRADILFKINQRPIQHILSRGQQKLWVYAIKLAQGEVLAYHKKQESVYLFDDLPAELDANYCGLLIKTLRERKAQVFITAIDAQQLEPLLPADKTRLFRLEDGTIRAESTRQLPVVSQRINEDAEIQGSPVFGRSYPASA